MKVLTPGKWWGMRRLADPAGRFQMTAVDQRPPIKNLISKKLDANEAPYEEVARFKAMLVEVLQEKSSAMLLDPHYALPRALPKLSPAKGLIVTLEDSKFAEADGGRLSSSIDGWDVGKIKRLGADAVKVLVWYRPDADPKICAAQQSYARQVGEQCCRYDIPFLLELLAYPLPGEQGQSKDYAEMANKKSRHVLDAVAEFAKPEYAVDMFKLESPISAGDVPQPGEAGWDVALETFTRMGKLAGRPWVMLSAGADPAAFVNVLACACTAGASGYLAGRSIWWQAFERYPDWEQVRAGLEADALPYMDRLNSVAEQHAIPWHDHLCYGPGGAQLEPADESFRHSYATL